MFGLTDYSFEKQEAAPGEILVHVKPPDSVIACCGSADLVKNGTKPLRIRDVSLGETRVGAVIHRQRYKCRNCGATLYQPTPQVSERHQMTERLERWIESEAKERPFAQIADEIAISEKTVRSIFNVRVAKLHAEFKTLTPAVIGIDEVFTRKRCMGLITNIVSRTIVDILPDRSRNTVFEFFSNLPDRERVEWVVMDFWPPYREAVRRHLPDARVVVDRWHAEANCSRALEAVRKVVRRESTRGHLDTLRGDRVILAKKESTLSAEEQENLARMLGQNPLLADAHRVKEGFGKVFESSDVDEARARLDEWFAAMPGSVSEYFRKFVRECREWRDEILAFTESKLTNASTERAVRDIRDLFRSGSGYSFEIIRAKILLTKRFRKEAKVSFGWAGTSMMGFQSGGSSDGLDLGVDLRELEAFLAEIADSGDTRKIGLIDSWDSSWARPVELDMSWYEPE